MGKGAIVAKGRRREHLPSRHFKRISHDFLYNFGRLFACTVLSELKRKWRSPVRAQTATFRENMGQRRRSFRLAVHPPAHAAPPITDQGARSPAALGRTHLQTGPRQHPKRSPTPTAETTSAPRRFETRAVSWTKNTITQWSP